jgi:hypothetical protein
MKTLQTTALALCSALALSACAGDPYGRYGYGPRDSWGPSWDPYTSGDRYYRWRDRRYGFSPRTDGSWYNRDLGYYHPAHGWWDAERRCWRGRDWSPDRAYGATVAIDPPTPIGGRGPIRCP